MSATYVFLHGKNLDKVRTRPYYDKFEYSKIHYFLKFHIVIRRRLLKVWYIDFINQETTKLLSKEA